MSNKVFWLLLLNCIGSNFGLLCYNCSATQHSWVGCAGDFAPSGRLFNSTRYYLVNCTGENATCFVRSWSARAKNAWLVQRGCYRSDRDDLLPQSVHIPTRAMTCKHQKLANAEYKVCVCQADWCNSASLDILPHFKHFANSGIGILIFIYRYTIL